MLQTVVEAKNVVKKFGDYAATNGVSITASKGRVFGLLGPNGAGKTTLIRMLTNILMPDSGEINVFGKPVSSDSQNRIGYLPEERGLYKKTKVIDQIAYFARLKDIPKALAYQKARFWLNRMDAGSWEPKKIQELSKGMQQKVQFIATIVHDPELIILDEPFSGLDPINVEVLINIILDLKNQGRTIILSSHVMEQAEKLCDDICLINRGKVALSGALRDVKKSFGKNNIIIEFDGDDSFLDNFTGVLFISRTQNRVELSINPELIKPQDILKAAISKAEIAKFEIVEPSLHEIFIDAVSKIEGRENEKN